jgi:hypothetical protein
MDVGGNGCLKYAGVRIVCTKLKDIILWVILSERCYMNKCLINNREVATNILMYVHGRNRKW